MNNNQARAGRTLDMSFIWLVKTYGKKWTQWQKLASKWMENQDRGVDAKRYALSSFFEMYLMNKAPYAINVENLFRGHNGHRCSSEEYMDVLKSNGLNDNEALVSRVNDLSTFIDWIIDNNFYMKDEFGAIYPTVTNPFNRIKKSQERNETVRNPLPYRYIKKLREILCPLPSSEELKEIEQKLLKDQKLDPPFYYRSFKHWTWAQNLTGQGLNSQNGDWFDIDYELIDHNDPDCVWRKKIKKIGNETITIFQMWSPVKAMVIFIKLHLPLRTYQIRFLDSGEADTWRYSKGEWLNNTHHEFAMGTAKRPYAKGVFKRIYDSMLGQYSTGLYISTNKTADMNKSEIDCGYTIPWQNEEVLYWLEKLRNWQEKYNPISEPTSFSSLEKRHFGNSKSDKIKAKMGFSCFLFRQPASRVSDRNKPLISDSTKIMWYSLLETLEIQLKKEGITLKNGTYLKLVEDYPEGTTKTAKLATFFPMHSLRVSLITSYTLDTDLPLPIISKLLAGHTRLIMTIYYNKITPAVMAEKMHDAENKILENTDSSIRVFLKNASMQKIEQQMSYLKISSIEAALANRNPINWEYRSDGLCLVGGNSAILEDFRTIGGCWNGGELIRSATNARDNIYAPVPHGPENCIRCRWFITEARFLPALNARFNQLSYKVHLASNLTIEIENEIDKLKDEQFFCAEQGKPFIKYNDLQALQRRYEKQTIEADEYTKDWISCFELIHKIIKIEEKRTESDNKQKLIAIGNKDDVRYALSFIETTSELLHLSLLCEDAEIFPDLKDELRKTPAIEKRSRHINQMMIRNGLEPVFLEMDEKQQLITINAMLRQMSKIADPDNKLEGYRKVVNYIEAGEYLSQKNLLNAGVSILTDEFLNFNKLVKLERLNK